MNRDRTYPFDEDLLPYVDWLGKVIGAGDKFMITAFMLSLAVGVREKCPRKGEHKRSNRGPRTGLKEEEFSLMQAVVSSVDPEAELEPGTDRFASTVCRYANGGLIQLYEQLGDLEEPRARLVAYLEKLAGESGG